MKCVTAREALSARIDGEQEPVPATAVDRHLATCASCRSWHARAVGLRRTMLLGPAPAVPDLTAAILDQLPAPAPRRSYALARLVLAVVAIAQTALALAQLFGADTGMGNENAVFMMGHMSHESAAWNVAIGIGLVWAALRPRTASAQLPMLTVFVTVLAAASVLDVVRGDVTADRLLSHIPVVVGVVLLYLVHRTQPDDGRPIQHAEFFDPDSDRTEAAALQAVRPEDHPALRHRRPAGRRRAA